MSNFAKQLERELAAVTEQRDRLAEALRPFSKMMGGHMFLRYDLVMDAKEALAAVKSQPTKS
jgi:hypothetical protein